MMPEMPWSKFFWSDWESDQGLRLCSLAAQGLWMRMLCVCARHEPKGYLSINGNPLQVDAIARLAGVTETEAETLMAELELNGVFSRNRSGCIYSRRMVRDEKRSQEGRKHKKRGLKEAAEKSNEKHRPSRGPSPQKPEARSQIKEREAKASPSLAVDHQPIDEVADAVLAYRATAERLGWPIPQQLDPPRRRAISARISDAGGIEGWRIAVEKAAASEFLGQPRPFSGFGIDWIAKPANFKKIMEGNYDDRRSPRPDHRAAASTDALRDTLDAAARMRRTSSPDWL